jgi:hypothetical protein
MLAISVDIRLKFVDIKTPVKIWSSNKSIEIVTIHSYRMQNLSFKTLVNTEGH